MPDTDNQPGFTGITTQHEEICQFKTPPTLTAEAKITLTRHNGQVEAQVNCLKLQKRLMFGRANFDLLRLRVLRRA